MKNIEQEFIIDKLTDSILNTISGDSFETNVSILNKTDLRTIQKKNGWNFNWKSEFQELENEVYKLTIINNPSIIQGLISLKIESGFIFINLLESAPFNVGKNKLYEGVPGNLVAFGCKLSFQLGFEGYVAFEAKTSLIKHYEESLGAFLLRNRRMVIDSIAAEFLVKKYFKVK
jgi:hypothetical protein